MSTIETKGPAVMTGASAGIGAVYADRLADWERFDAPRDGTLSSTVLARR